MKPRPLKWKIALLFANCGRMNFIMVCSKRDLFTKIKTYMNVYMRVVELNVGHINFYVDEIGNSDGADQGSNKTVVGVNIHSHDEFSCVVNRTNKSFPEK